MTYAHKQASLKAHLKKAAKDNTDMLIIFDEAGVQIKAKNYLKEDVHTTLQEASSHILQILGPFHE